MGDYQWVQQLFGGNQYFKAQACHEVALLAYSSADVAADLVLNGFLDRVLAVARDFVRANAIQREVCVAVSTLLGAKRVTDPVKRSMVCRVLVPREFIGAISCAFRGFPKDPVIREVACTFVANEFNYYRSRIIQEVDTYVNLVPLISAAVNDEQLGTKLAAIRAISTMADVQCPQILRSIQKCGVTEAIKMTLCGVKQYDVRSGEAPTYKESVSWCMNALRNIWFFEGGDTAVLTATDILMEFGTHDVGIARSGMRLLSIVSAEEAMRKCIISHVDARFLHVARKCMVNVGDCMESAHDSVTALFNVLREGDFIDANIVLGFLNEVIGSFCIRKFLLRGRTDASVSTACRSICRLRNITSMSNVNQYLQHIRGLLVLLVGERREASIISAVFQSIRHLVYLPDMGIAIARAIMTQHEMGGLIMQELMYAAANKMETIDSGCARWAWASLGVLIESRVVDARKAFPGIAKIMAVSLRKFCENLRIVSKVCVAVSEYARLKHFDTQDELAKEGVIDAALEVVHKYPKVTLVLRMIENLCHMNKDNCKRIVEGGAWDTISRVFCEDKQVRLSETTALIGVMFALGRMRVTRPILYMEETRELVDRIAEEIATKDREDPLVKTMWGNIEYARMHYDRMHASSSPRTPPQKRIRVV